MPRTLILSGSSRETFAYAKSIGLKTRQVQHAFTGDTVDGIYFPQIVELPSYAKRRDRHGVESVLKRMLRKWDRIGKPVDRFVDAEWVYTRPEPQIEGELPGQTTIDDFLVSEETSPADRELTERVAPETPSVNKHSPEIRENADNGTSAKPKRNRESGPAKTRRPAAKKAVQKDRPASLDKAPDSNTLEPESVPFDVAAFFGDD